MENLEDDNTKIFLNKKGLRNMPPISSEVKHLEARRNMIESLAFPRYSELEYLDVSDNVISSMNPISGLKKLKILDMGYNLIQHIPKLELPSLNELYLMSNDICRIENMDFEELTKCDLANNELKTLDGIRCLKLEEGYFGANHISCIPDLKHLQQLKILDLQYNKLDEVDCTLLPRSIEVLLLNNNKGLTKLHNLDYLGNLKLLGIKNTKVAGD
ncbi:uncharacterized protein VICG_00480 [Vittaforma corneae ATCC 50505]|uniref:Protein phosphatase 1 regulatory subunit 7 n=1 Tax=Vittaforma corneae (strain ATCC 50505) TaxID=993615 RepID=L2GNG5_VITCO|nr:uncharacterized protein VICG_00480 [Vittaforma corneae ATCC 50505]ELA42381.1 hypothetical protein VICG_00480 [Vittaforma corneae ATCC 50505]